MSLNKTLANTGKQVATQAADKAIDAAVDKSTVGTTGKGQLGKLTSLSHL